MFRRDPITECYDNANRKKWEDQTLNGGPTRRVETLLDGDGNRRTLTVAGVQEGYAFTYEYTRRQQLLYINKTGSADHYFVYTHDPNGNLKKRQDTLQGGDSTIFDYDKANRVTLCVQTGAGDAAFSRSNYNDYDLVNNLKSITREEDFWKGERFEYDDANQLRSASYRVDVAPHAPEQPDPVPGQLGTVGDLSEDSEKEALAVLEADPDREPLAEKGGSGTDQYGPGLVTYLNDSINRLSMNDNGTVTNYVPNSLNQYASVANHTLLYDTKFNLLSGYDDWVYTYDADKRLIWAGTAAGQGHTAQFVYDGLGRCVKRTIDGVATVFTYDEWKPIVEWTGAGVFVAWNLYGPGSDEILVRYQPNTGSYVHYKLDAMGNVQFLLSGQNLGLEKYTYDAFGKPKIVGWNGDVRGISLYGNRFLFTGREYLYTLGIYDYRHRHYHPGLGRFIQTDPIGFGGDPSNLYRYSGGNPIFHSDPTGLQETNDGNLKCLTPFTGWGGGDWDFFNGRVALDQVDSQRAEGQGASASQSAPKPIEQAGQLAVDTDGTGANKNDPTSDSGIPAGVDANGNIVPRYLDNGKGAVNPAMVRPLNAEDDSFAVAPKQYAPANEGATTGGVIIPPGARATGTLSDGRVIESRVGDYGPPGKVGEFSVKALRDHGIPMFNVKGVGPVPSLDGRAKSDIPVIMRYYP
jgi:RHS repeat-associated protein